MLPHTVHGQSVDVPAKPTGLTGEVAHGSASLTWGDPQDDSITGYQIRRRDRTVDDLGVFHTHVDDTGSAATAYEDTDVVAGGRYTYRIKARNAAGLSDRSSYLRRRPARPAAGPRPHANAGAGAAATRRRGTPPSGPAHRPDRHSNARRCVPDLGRPPGPLNHRLSDTAARQGRRRHGCLPHPRGRHRKRHRVCGTDVEAGARYLYRVCPSGTRSSRIPCGWSPEGMGSWYRMVTLPLSTVTFRTTRLSSSCASSGSSAPM